MPESWIESFLRRKGPMSVSEIRGIESKTGAKTEGVFVGCPLTPAMMLGGDLEATYASIMAAVELAREQGAQVVGLGAFTSVVGDGGVSIAKASKVPITTGNSYTVATAIDGALKAADMLGIDFATSSLAVVGATGSIGKTCARVLAPAFAETLLVGRDLERTNALASELPRSRASTNVSDLREADVIVTVTSSESAIIEPEHLKVGALVCDVARPRDVSRRVAAKRQDVLVVEGGIVKVPGPVDFGFDFGFPPGTAYACMSETMMLALEDRAESFTLGKDVSVEQVEQTRGWAAKHGFELAGFRAFEREVPAEAIERVRRARQEA